MLIRRLPQCFMFAALAALWVPAMAANGTSVMSIDVTTSRPGIPGIGVDSSQLPFGVQTQNAAAIRKQEPLNASKFLSDNLNGVTVNDAQNNPYQPDISFRGFTASPVLGTPQGLSIYVDGVRVNEPFGDVVNWDLIPESAIESVSMVPGSNPMFGLNSLGGSVVVTTKSGADFPGVAAKVFGGSFGRYGLQVEGGGSSGRYDYFATVNGVHSDGWAEHNPSDVAQAFAKVGYRGARTKLNLSITSADTRLSGAQTLPLAMLDKPRQSYTWPDYATHHLLFLNTTGRHQFSDALVLAGNVYFRRLDSGELDSNVNDAFDSLQPVSAANSPGLNDRSNTKENGYGGTLRLIIHQGGKSIRSRLVLGGTADLADTDFNQKEQPTQITSARETVGFAPYVLQTRLTARNRYYGLYAYDTLGLGKRTTLTLAGRYNWAHVRLLDKLGTALNGEHDFSRFNPAVGLNITPRRGLDTYVSYSEGMRTPTPVELTCADPNAPCTLPNNFLSDPGLRPVISKTWELGARGRLNGGWRWHSALYRTDLHDDIEFISLNGLQGYFQNVPETRHQGVELSINGAIGRLGLTAQYTYTDATFQAAFTEASPDNSSADGSGLITVQPGDHVPGIPPHVFKLRLSYPFTGRLRVSTIIQAQSGQYARGDENNRDVHGKVPGYVVAGLDASYRVARRWRAFLQVSNLFDTKYYSLGVLGANDFTGPGGSFDPAGGESTQFRSVGAPFGAWLGVRYSSQLL
jgi:iron complex outermembrane receptor protein